MLNRIICFVSFQVLLCLLLFTHTGKAQNARFKVKNYCQSQWLTHPIVIDGKANEYHLPLDNYDPKTKVQYSIYNDAEYVYFCFLMTDEIMETNTLVSGMEIWIDTTGKKKKQCMVLFPLPSKDNMESTSAPATKEISAEMKHEKYALTKEKIEYKLTGFKEYNGIHGIKDSTGFQLAINWDKGDMLVYELKIPIKSFHKILVPLDSLKDFGLTIHILAHDITKINTHTEAGSHEGGGMGTSGNRNIHGNNNSIHANSQNTPLFEDQIYHTRFRLSTR